MAEELCKNSSQAGSDSGDDEEGDWEDWESGGDAQEGDEDVEPTRSLFCDTMLCSPEAAIRFDAERFGFNLCQYAIEQRLDEYDIFRCINWVRRQSQQQQQALSAAGDNAGTAAAAATSLPAMLASSQQPWRGDDAYLVPTLQDDALLFHDYEGVVATWRCVRFVAWRACWWGGAAYGVGRPQAPIFHEDVVVTGRCRMHGGRCMVVHGGAWRFALMEGGRMEDSTWGLSVDDGDVAAGSGAWEECGLI